MQHDPRLIIPVLDVAIGAGALLSSYLWWLASRSRLRRISRHEDLDAADINRIVTALNRSQILNSRAAFIASVTASLAGLRMLAQALLDS